MMGFPMYCRGRIIPQLIKQGFSSQPLLNGFQVNSMIHKEANFISVVFIGVITCYKATSNNIYLYVYVCIYVYIYKIYINIDIYIYTNIVDLDSAVIYLISR